MTAAEALNSTNEVNGMHTGISEIIIIQFCIILQLQDVQQVSGMYAIVRSAKGLLQL